ncbi:MAG: Ig-like domain repeat protein, partial [Oligoflexales bacterium]|nr:Ig-like domain repeat protein [Oligoflexales bacterium]
MKEVFKFIPLFLLMLSVACQPASEKAKKSATTTEDPLPIAGEDFDFIQPGEVKTLDASRAKVYFVAETLNQAIYAAIVVNKKALTHSPDDERGNISLVMQTEDGSPAGDIVLNEGLKIMIKAFDLTNLPGVRVVVLDDEDKIIDTINNNKLTTEKNSKGIYEVSFSTFYTNATFVLIEPAALDPRFYVNQTELELLAEQQAIADFRTLSFDQRYAQELAITVNLEAKSSTFKEFHFGEGTDCAEFTLQTESVREFSYALSPTEGLKTLCLLLRNSWGDEASSTQTIFYDEFVPESVIEIAAILGPESSVGVSTSLSGTASDSEAGSGIDQVLVTVEDSAGACLNQTKTAFDQTCPIWLTATGRESWALNVPDTLFIHDETYTLSAKAYDKAGREQTTAGTDNFVWDGSAPQSLFVINNDDSFTSDENVVLTLVDDEDVFEYRVAVGEDCTAAEWEEYSSPLTYALESVDGEKTLCLQTRDTVLNQSEVSIDTIILDTELPTSEADLLSDIGPTTTDGVTTIFAGEAVDLGSGIVLVEASLENSGQCLNSALSNFNQACPHWIEVDGTETWTLEVLDALFTNNQTYVMRTRATDGIGNIQNPVFAENFSWRENGPNPIFNLNSAASFSSNPVLDVIFQNSTGISHYRKEELADCGAVTWDDNDWNIFSGSLTHIIDGGDGAIRVCIQVKDNLDNLSSVSFDDITYDTQEGSSSISTSGTMGPSTEVGANSTISGTASDITSGVSLVHMSLQQGAGSCLNAGKTAFNAACPQWHITSGTVNWNFSVADNLFVDGTTYNISSRVTDNANNVEATLATSSFTWDTSSPNASFLINNNDQYTNSVVVSLDITDDSEIEIYGADLLGCATAANIAYAGGGAIENFVLTGADGTKTVCLKVLDSVANSAQSTDTIILDTTLPDSVINMSGYIGPDSTAGANTVLAGVSSDATSGIAEVYVSLQYNNNFCLNSLKTAFNAACPEWHVASGTTTWSLTLADTLFSDGAYSMQSKAVDNAGNIETAYGTASFSWLVGAPNANFSINGGDLYTDSASISLDLVDDTAVTEYFAEEGNCAAPVYQNYAGSGSISFNLSGGDGDKTVCLILKNAATYESNIVYQSIMLDSTAPTSAITTTAEIGPNTTAGATTFIEGTASDASSGVAQINISLQRDSTGLYLNSAKTNFNAVAPVWHTAIGDNDWYLTVSDSLFVAAADYNIEVIAVDNAGTEQGAATTLTVIWDETAPSADFTINSDDAATHLLAVQLDLVDDSGIAEYIAEEGDCSSTSYSAYGGGGSIALNLSAGSALKSVCLK